MTRLHYILNLDWFQSFRQLHLELMKSLLLLVIQFGDPAQANLSAFNSPR